MRELGYHPSALGRSLALQRTHTIGFITPNVSDPFYGEMVRGVEEAASAAGYNLLIASQPVLAEQRQIQQLFTQGRVDGLILVAINVRPDELEQLTAQGIPVTVIQEDLGGKVPTFVADNYGGARALVEHLVNHDYRRIAYISGSDFTPDSSERLRALRDVLAENGLTLADEYIAHGDFTAASGHRAMKQLLKLPIRPEAVFAANDHMAIAAMRTARESGLRVPEDIAIAGFDDLHLAAYTSPPLTTVRQPLYDMGRLAVESILAPLGVGDQRRVMLPTTLVVRESCGCDPQPEGGPEA